MILEFNKELLYKSYKFIWLDCMKDGLTVPYLIKNNVPREYYPSFSERQSLKLTKKQREKLSEAYYNRRLKEIGLWKSTSSENKRLKLLTRYWENELTDFINNYPKYKRIIKE